MIWIELLILLACIFVGARLGGIALGTIAGIGLLVFVFGFELPPGSLPGGGHRNDHRRDHLFGCNAGGREA